MRQISSEAFLLDVTDLQEGDRIVTFLTPEFGRKRGVARGAKTKYSRYAGLLQPLARLHLTWFERDDRELVRLRDVTLVRAAGWVERDLESVLLGSYLAEHMTLFAQDNEPGSALFRLLAAVSEALEQELDQDAVARYFEFWVLRLAGLFPPPIECPLCERPFDAAGAILPEGGDSLVCRECSGTAAGDSVTGATLSVLLNVMRRSPDRFATGGVAAGDLRNLERLAGSLRRRFLGHELRSYQVMKRTLNEVGSGS